MTAAVAVQRAEQAFLLDHFPKRSHDRPRRFLFDQLGVVDLARGVIQNDDHVIPAVVLQPAVLAAIDVQQHARKRPPLSTPTAYRNMKAGARNVNSPPYSPKPRLTDSGLSTFRTLRDGFPVQEFPANSEQFMERSTHHDHSGSIYR